MSGEGRLSGVGGSIGCCAEDGDRPRAADGPGGTGLRRAAAGRLGDPAASYAGVGSNPAAAVGFGVGTGPGALPAGIQPAGSVPEAAARRRRVGVPGAPSSPAAGVLGPRGGADPGSGLAGGAFGCQDAWLVAEGRAAGSSRARAWL